MSKWPTRCQKDGESGWIGTTPRFREDRFRELFETPARPSAPPPTTAPAAPAAPAARDTDAARPDTTRRDTSRAVPTRRFEPVFDDIRRRLTVVPTGLDVFGVSISPDGKSALLTASAANQLNLYVYSLDELATEPPVARQITSTAGFKQFAQWSSDSKEVYYLEGGRINYHGPAQRLKDEPELLQSAYLLAGIPDAI